MTALNLPLTEGEYDRLGSMLARSDRAMNLEMVDGFFAALICGPETVPPSEYLRLIWGGDKIGGEKGWRDEAEMQEFFDLMMRHWNSIAGPLSSGDVFVPLLLEDDDGVTHANDWAEGFARGIKLRSNDWGKLSMIRSMRGCSCQFSHSHMSAIPIPLCGHTKSQLMRSAVSNSLLARPRAS